MTEASGRAVCGRLVAATSGSNPFLGMDVFFLLCLCVALSYVGRGL
jgi:hypothetical protein